jgi:uncharacterized protein
MMTAKTDIPEFSTLPDDLQAKLARCQEILRGLKTVVVAFSGGSDSTFLLALAARTLGAANVLAAIGTSPSLPGRELADARQLAGRIGVTLVELPTTEMGHPEFVANPPDRCFHCKKELFTGLKALAAGHGMSAVVCGANADDTGDYRPGLAAGKEMGIVNPLLEATLAKQEIRTAAHALDLPTWNKPAYACLASRIPYGQSITAEKLGRIEKAEYALLDLGFTSCRVRDHGQVARIEVPADQLERAVSLRKEIAQAVKQAGYVFVALDLEGFRSGSMNEVLSPETRKQK